MPNIEPISELRNYGKILEKVEPNKPVYLTKNGKGQYSVHSIEDDKKYEEALAMIQLLTELNNGLESGRTKGWHSEKDVNTYFANKRKELEGRSSR